MSVKIEYCKGSSSIVGRRNMVAYQKMKQVGKRKPLNWFRTFLECHICTKALSSAEIIVLLLSSSNFILAHLFKNCVRRLPIRVKNPVVIPNNKYSSTSILAIRNSPSVFSAIKKKKYPKRALIKIDTITPSSRSEGITYWTNFLLPKYLET